MALLLRPQVQLDEGPQGYLARLAEANRISAKDLARLGIHFFAPVLRQERCVSPEGNNLELDFYLEAVGNSLIAFPGSWVRRVSRYCPKCLNKSPQWRVGWELLFADACPEHQVWLVETCNKCNKLLSWDRECLLRCNCGWRLSDQPTADCPDAVSRLSKTLADSISTAVAEDAIGPISKLSTAQIQRLVRFLGSYADPCPGPRPQKIPNLDRLSVSWRLVSLAAEILARWPDTLYTVLDRMQAQGTDKGGGRLGGRFGYFYTALYRGFPGVEFSVLRDAFENYLAENWRGSLARRNRRLSPRILDRAAWIPANHACERLAISRRRLTQLIAEAKIASETRIGITGREFIVVKREDVNRQLDELEQEVNLLEAAAALGLTKRRMRAMVGVLFPNAFLSAGAGTAWAIPRPQIDAYVNLLSDQPTISKVVDGMVAFRHVLQFWAWTDRAIGAALGAALEKTMVPVGVMKGVPGVPGLVFQEEDLRDWYRRSQQTTHNMLTIPAVAERVGIKQEVAYALVRSGLLPTVELQTGSRSGGQGVSLAALEEFGNRYKFARDMAVRVGRSSKATIRLLGVLGVLPVCGPQIDGCRQVLFESTPALTKAIQIVSRFHDRY